MRLSRTELRLLEQVALGRRTVVEVASALGRDISQVYRIVRSLDEKGFARIEHGLITPHESTHASILLQELSKHPGIANNLSGCGIALFTALLAPKSVSELSSETMIKRSTIFYKLKEATQNSFINIEGKKYFFNDKIWPGVKGFLAELKRHEESTDKRVPPGGIIYCKSQDEIVFSTKVECDAAMTGFSAYEKFGINILAVDYTYYLPKKSLTRRDVFLHSLLRAEKDGDARDFGIIALFYLKNKRSLAGIKHPIVDNLNRVLKGEKVKYYPSLAEIREKAEVYDIKI